MYVALKAVINAVQLVRLVNRARGVRVSSLIVMLGYVLSRATGLLRDLIISAQFGTSDSLAAYYAAFRVTDFLYMIVIGGALGSTFIPVFLEVWNRDGSERAWRLANTVVTWVLGLLALASALLWVLAPWLTEFLFAGPDFGPEELAITSGLTRLFLLSPLLLGLGGLAMAALNAHDRFTLPALAPAIYNLGIIGGAIFLTPLLGVWGLGWGVVIGAACYLLIQLPGLWQLGMQLRPTLGHDIPERVTILWQMLPRVIGQAASQMSLLVTAALTAQYLQASQLAGLNFAYQIMLLPYGIFSLSLSTVAFPLLARLFAEGELATLADRIRRTLGTILFLTVPAAVALTILAVPVVRLLYQRGAFDANSVIDTAIPLLGYALAIPAFAASEILIRSFYAMQRTFIPVGVGLLQVALNLGFGTAAMQLGYGVGALTLIFSLANTVEALLLAVLLGLVLPRLWHNRIFWRSLLAVLVGSGLLGGLLWLVWLFSLPWLPYLDLTGTYRWPGDALVLAIWLAGVGGVGTLLYLGVTLVLGAPAAREIWQRLWRMETET